MVIKIIETVTNRISSLYVKIQHLQENSLFIKRDYRKIGTADIQLLKIDIGLVNYTVVLANF